MQVLYLGRAPRTKETLPDFSEKCRVTRHSRVFRGLTGSQRTPRVRGVTIGFFIVDVKGRLKEVVTCPDLRMISETFPFNFLAYEANFFPKGTSRK